MIKKVGLFFSTPIRRRMEKDYDFRSSAGLQKAVSLSSQFLQVCISKSLDEFEAKAKDEACWKFFHFGHAENGLLKNAFSKSQRVEAVILPYGFGAIALHLLYFVKGEKRAFFRIDMAIAEETGRVETLACAGGGV